MMSSIHHAAVKRRFTREGDLFGYYDMIYTNEDMRCFLADEKASEGPHPKKSKTLTLKWSVPKLGGA